MSLAIGKNKAAMAGPGRRFIDWTVVPLFASTLFISACLLFWIQPLFAKMALPYLGGAPAVWNTAMMFFQATLLLGYTYVHFISQWLTHRWQVAVHLSVVAIALLTLPVAVHGNYNPDETPLIGLIGLLTVSIGLPFFAVSATAPLLQRWFALVGHRHAADPYFLYGASNLGSILALLAFPLILEPTLNLGEQGIAWSIGVALLFVLIGVCALVPMKSSAKARKTSLPTKAHATDRWQNWRQRLFWIALAFAPSSLLLAVTQHISTDVAPVPLLWIIPLALYLLSFVIVFARRPALPHAWVLRVQPYVLTLILVYIMVHRTNIWLLVAVHLSALFLLALSCHGELVKRRPDVKKLTDFYLCMSVGGLLGGVFNVLAAPILFDGVYEYGLAVVVAALLHPGSWRGPLRQYLLDISLPLAIVVFSLLLVNIDLPKDYQAYEAPAQVALICVIGIVVFGFCGRPLRYGLGIGAALIVYVSTLSSGDILTQARSFFGVYRVKLSDDGLARELYHGTTIHGSQLIEKSLSLEPVSYYSRQGPLGQVFKEFRKRRSDLNVGLVGLGVGSSLCYMQPDDQWTIFELDPLVVQIASNEEYFSFVSECDISDATRYLIGDARLKLDEVKASSLDLMVLDAYSSDAVPLHLLTKEALALYRTKMKKGGILMLHVSNRHLQLDRVLSAIVHDANMSAVILRHKPDRKAFKHTVVSHWVAVAENSADLSMLKDNGKWRDLPPVKLRPWTDGYSNIIDVLK
jgi:hypothetical protein